MKPADIPTKCIGKLHLWRWQWASPSEAGHPPPFMPCQCHDYTWPLDDHGISHLTPQNTIPWDQPPDTIRERTIMLVIDE